MKKVFLILPLILLTTLACGLLPVIGIPGNKTPTPQTKTPDKSALLKKVVWVDKDGIWAPNSSGTGVKRLAIFSQFTTMENASISWDGKRVVFEGNLPNVLYVSDVDGSNLKQITDDGRTSKYPAWSPDGKSIVFYTLKKDNSSINIVDIETLAVRDIFLLQKAAGIDPVFSPDGKQIAYSNIQLYTISVDGSNLIQLTDFTETSLIVDKAWSPDGKRIVFMKMHQEKMNDQMTQVPVGYDDLYLIDADGSNLTRLTNSPETEFDIFWTADSKTVVFKSRPDDLKRLSEHKVYALDADGTNLRLLSEVNWKDYAPKITSTPIIPTATPRVKSIEVPLKASLTLLGGPIDGNLVHQTQYISTNCVNNKVRDFQAEAVLYNPYSTSKAKFDFGFLFRNLGGNINLRLAVTSSGNWNLSNWTEQDSKEIIKGSIKVNTGEKDANRIKLVAAGTTGYFYLNDTLVSTLDLSARLDTGSVCLAAGFYKGNKIEGAKTPFEDFYVWSLTTP